MISAIRKLVIDVITNPNTGRVSHTKLAASTAYFIGTVCFLWFHCFIFSQNTPIEKFNSSINIMPELWLFYFGVIAGHSGANKYLAQIRSKKNQVDQDA